MKTVEEVMPEFEYRKLMDKVRRLERITGRKIDIQAEQEDWHNYRVIYRAPGDHRRIHHKQLTLF